MSKLAVLEFVRTFPEDWKRRLKDDYQIKITEKKPYIMLHYDIGADFNKQIVRECRSLILREDIVSDRSTTYTVVAMPFFKFGNYGESYADEINWAKAEVQEKIDGSMIIVWRDINGVHVSTSGCIDAADAPLPPNSAGFSNYRELFDYAAKFQKADITKLPVPYTWIFELASPYNRVVVPYKKPALYMIGCRNIYTYEECKPWDAEARGFLVPKIYSLGSLDKCIEAAEKLPYDDEGFVVVDKNWHRVKVKSPAWVAVHHFIGNGFMSEKRLLKILDDAPEFLTYFPEYTETIKELEFEIKNICEDIDRIFGSIKNVFVNRADFAKYVLQTPYSSALFAMRDEKIKTGYEFWNQLTTDKKARFLENVRNKK